MVGCDGFSHSFDGLTWYGRQREEGGNGGLDATRRGGIESAGRCLVHQKNGLNLFGRLLGGVRSLLMLLRTDEVSS